MNATAADIFARFDALELLSRFTAPVLCLLLVALVCALYRAVRP